MDDLKLFIDAKAAAERERNLHLHQVAVAWTRVWFANVALRYPVMLAAQGTFGQPVVKAPPWWQRNN